MTIPAYLQKCFSPPNQERLARSTLFAKDFSIALRDLSESTARAKANSPNLLNASYAQHPDVHRGYYDEIQNDVFMVVDIAGNLVRKDLTALTTNGEFILSKSSRLLLSLPGTLRTKALRALEGVREDQDYFKDKYIYVPEICMYTPFDWTLVRRQIRIDRFLSLLNRLYSEFCNAHFLTTLPQNEEDLPAYHDVTGYIRANIKKHTAYWEYTDVGLYSSESTYAKTHTIEIKNPDDNTFNELVISGDYVRVLFNEAGQQGFRPLIDLTQINRIDWRPHDYTNTYVLPNNILKDFDLGIRMQRQTKVKENKLTANNHGELLGYNTKVDELKKSFLMLDEEQKFFDHLEKDYKTRYKEYKERQNDAVKKGSPFKEKAPALVAEEQPIFLGVEIEVIAKGPNATNEGVQTIIKKIADSKFGDHCIIKFDRSIGKYGLEIVTIPASLSYHKKMFTENFFNPINPLNKLLRSDNLCGLHVHISKKSFTTLTLGKFMAFINHQDNAKFINALANRTPNKYCVKANLRGKNAKGVDLSAAVVVKGCADHEVGKGLRYTQLEHRDETRRVSVNLDNAHTVEVRIFKSTSSKNDLFRKMEFCEALLKFARQHSMQQMTVYDFVEFILEKGNNKRYRHLVRWMASKNYVGHEMKKIHGVDKYVHIYAENKVPKPNNIYHDNINKRETK